MKKILLSTFMLVVSLSGSAQKLVDQKATPETKALFKNMQQLAQHHILFGHHEDMAYGVTWVAQAGRSDVKDVCGSYPAVHGWDLGREGNAKNIDGVDFASMHQWIKEVYDRQGVNTISWHLDNPMNGKSSWDTTNTVKHILPGGKDHARYVAQLDKVALFLENCKSGSTFVPIIFRPFHEHNGNWFWWGKGNCSEEEYIKLWRFTVNYLKNEKELHHLLYAFSPDRSRMDMSNPKSSYLYGYPGDEYVDILGSDNYMDVGVKWNKKSTDVQAKELAESLRAISQLAAEKNKVAALTETGLEGVTNPVWFTDVILKPLKANPDIHLAYIMLWRNANGQHHYASYPGHSSTGNFLEFYNDPYTLFEADLQNLYKTGNPLIR